MRLPNFLIIGANKGGTTSLYHYLAQHPAIYMSAIKEPMFFALEGNPALAEANSRWGAIHRLEEYAALFEPVTAQTAWGEASTTYLCTPWVAPNIARHVPQVKLMAVLRHPIERAHSQYAMNVRLGLEDLPSFEAAVSNELDGPGAREYVRLGNYATQLERYLEHFPWRQLLVLIYRDLAAAPLGVMRQIFRFLEVDDTFVPDVSRRHNTASEDRPVGKGGRRHAWLQRLRPPAPAIPPALRARLVEVYRPEVMRLQDLLGRDLSAWLA